MSKKTGYLTNLNARFFLCYGLFFVVRKTTILLEPENLEGIGEHAWSLICLTKGWVVNAGNSNFHLVVNTDIPRPTQTNSKRLFHLRKI